MKLSIFFTLMILLISCGKKNESGKSKVHVPSQEYYSLGDETLIRKDFIREGEDILERYESVMKEMFGLRTVGLIRNRLKYDNVHVTEALIMNENQQYIRSIHRNYLVTLYIGRGEQNLSWARFHKEKNMAYTRLVMHELLLLGEIDDRDFYYTDKILVPARRRHQ